MKRFALFVLLLLLTGVLAACTAAQPQATPTFNNAYLTEAVETVYAQLTVDAALLTPPAPVATEALLPTATLAALATQALPTEILLPSATATLQNTATPLPSATPVVLPVSTLSTEDIRVTLGAPSFKDSFDNDDGWSFGKDTHTDMYVKDGNAVLVAFNADYYYGWSQSWPLLKDSYVEIKVQTGPECSGQDKYGLIFRSPDPSQGYLAGLTCDGKYGLWYYDGKKENYLVKWEASNLIVTGVNQTNRLGVKAVGDKISIYINGRLVREFTDATYKEGKYGLMVGAVNTQNFTVFVDQLDYWEIK